MASEIILNGMNGDTGAYYTSRIIENQAIACITADPAGPENLDIVRSLHQQATQPHLGLGWDRASAISGYFQAYH
jgi:hypothetical protein